MSEKKQKPNLHLDCLEGISLRDQSECFDNAMAELDDPDFEKIDVICTKLMQRLQYNNIRAIITYEDAREILAKLGMYLNEVYPEKKSDG